jgi:hypothetical protein
LKEKGGNRVGERRFSLAQVSAIVNSTDVALIWA